MELQAGVGKIGFVFCGSLWRDRTAILMTHRFTTAMLADEIRVMGHCELWGEPVGQPGSLHFAGRSDGVQSKVAEIEPVIGDALKKLSHFF